MEACELLEWLRSYRRALPWRTPFPRDPYLVVVSEVMLQQTQAERVAQRLPAFLQRFPNLEALAKAPQDEVVAAFAGLGYYHRARLLHQLARHVYGIGWPQRADELVKLPGLGPYTAAAVAAFSFGQATPPVDGNLCRVVARLRALPLALGSAALREQARRDALGLFAQAQTVEVFEGLMELGALVCTPKNPACSSCPWQARCLARRQGEPERFPLPQRRRAPESVSWVALWLEESQGRVLLQQLCQPPLAGLWLPPLDRGEGEPQKRAWQLACQLARPTTPRWLGSLSHHITHRRITVHLYHLRLSDQAAEVGDAYRWWQPGDGVPTSSLLAKMAALVSEKEGRE